MTLLATYPFSDSINYVFSGTENVAGKAKLAFIPNPGAVWSEPITDDTGFTYDNTKAEFTGGLVRQKDQRATNSVAGATYTSSKDLSWINSGSITHTDKGTTTLNAGKLECLGGGNNGVRYTSAEIGNIGDTLAIRFRYTPNYSGTPPTNYNLIEFRPPAGNNDKFFIFHRSTGPLAITAYSSTGVLTHSAVAMGANFNPVAGTEYEIEYNINTPTGEIEVFVDGVLLGATPATVFVRGTTATIMEVGAGTGYTAANGSFNDVLLFSSVQHTAGYVAGYTVPETIYYASQVDIPNHVHGGSGVVQSIQSAAFVESNTPRYTIEGKYWNGSAWVASNNTYAQANSSTDLNTNLPTLNVLGESILSMSIFFQGQNVQGSVSDISVTYTGQEYPLTGYLEPSQALQVNNLTNYSQSVTNTANTSVKVILKVDGSLKYWNGSAWVASNGSEAQSNTASDFDTNIPSYVFGSNSSVYLRWLLITTDVLETPELDEADIEYDFGGVEQNPPKCRVYGYVKDITDSPMVGADITFSRVKVETTDYSEAGNNIILGNSVSVVSDADGYFSVDLIRSSEYEVPATYAVSILDGGEAITTPEESLQFSVPDSDTKDITDLLSE